jgi:hypothetical protein
MSSKGILAALLASVAVMAGCGEEKSPEVDLVRAALASGEVKGLADSFDCRLLERDTGDAGGRRGEGGGADQRRVSRRAAIGLQSGLLRAAATAFKPRRKRL